MTNAPTNTDQKPAPQQDQGTPKPANEQNQQGAQKNANDKPNEQQK